MTSSSVSRAQVLDGTPPTATPDEWQARLRRFGYVGRPRTDTRERLVPPFPKPSTRIPTEWLAWLGPVLVAALAAAIRLWHLGRPRDVVFDETYYAKDAWSLLQFGYEGTWPDRKIADPQILADPQVIPLSDTGAFVAHPPMGKWVIAVGEWMFGLDPFGWRFTTAILGALSVLMLCRIGRRLFRSTALGCLAGALLAVDGLHYVMSRTALLDLIVMFFVLAAFGSLRSTATTPGPDSRPPCPSVRTAMPARTCTPASTPGREYVHGGSRPASSWGWRPRPNGTACTSSPSSWS
jgi:hypothetical protein